jgi:hypothetical protein
VVDDLAAAHRGRERLGVEDVAADRLRPQRPERARRLVGPHEHLDCAPFGEKALNDGPAHEPAAAGDQGGVRQLEPSDRADPKRARYSTADSTVIAAATSIAHSSRSSGPKGSS